jgi:hypothetical protein
MFHYLTIAFPTEFWQNEYDSGFVLRSQNNSSQFNHVSDLLGRALSELFTYTRSKGVVQQSLFRFFGLILDRSGVDADLVNKFIRYIAVHVCFAKCFFLHICF